MKKMLYAVVTIAMLSVAAQATTITNATQFATTVTGAYDTTVNSSLWNTLPGDAIFNLWFSSDAAGTTFLNGPADSQAAINFTLPTGNTTYFIWAEPGANMTNNGLNLFFDGLLTPGISVKGATGSNVFSANGSPNTGSTTATSVAGANSLTYTSGGLLVTLTAYNWNNPASTDKVGPFTVGPNGKADFQGSFTLNVQPTSVPEPTTFALCSTVLLAGAFLRRRIRKN